MGKSSLINMLTNHSGLAKTSGTPGKTQLINHFIVDDDWYLVDLPGYGYAKVSKSERANFRKLIEGYFSSREQMLAAFVLIDIRHHPQPIDLEFMRWLNQQGVPFLIVFTKADKLGDKEAELKAAAYLEHLKATEWEEAPGHFITSSEKKTGREEILQWIAQLNREYRNYLNSK